MSWRIEFRPAAKRDLTGLEPFVRRKVILDIDKLAENPRPRGVEKTRGERQALSRQ